jgi:hypothetical protein
MRFSEGCHTAQHDAARSYDYFQKNIPGPFRRVKICLDGVRNLGQIGGNLPAGLLPANRKMSGSARAACHSPCVFRAIALIHAQVVIPLDRHRDPHLLR